MKTDKRNLYRTVHSSATEKFIRFSRPTEGGGLQGDNNNTRYVRSGTSQTIEL